MSRRWLKPTAAAIVVAMLLAGGGFWVYQKGRGAKVATQKPQSVLVADFANHAGDAVFDGTLEPAFTIALEGASFVSSSTGARHARSPRSSRRAPPASTRPSPASSRFAKASTSSRPDPSTSSGAATRSPSGRSTPGPARPSSRTARALLEKRRSSPPWPGSPRRSAGPRRRHARIHPARRRRDLHRRVTGSRARVRPRAEPAMGRQLGQAIRHYQQSAGPRWQPRPGLCGSGRRREQSWTAPGRREELQGGPRPHRPDQRAREVPDARRLLPPDAEPRQCDRRVQRPRQAVPGRHGRHREPGLRVLRQAGHGQRPQRGGAAPSRSTRRTSPSGTTSA